MKFLVNVLSTIVGIFVFLMLLCFGILLIGSIFGSSSDKTKVSDNSVILLDMSKIKEDYAGKFNFKDFNYFEVKHDGLQDMLNALKSAKSDRKIKGISILNNEMHLGMAQTKTLRDGLLDFKKTGKFIMAYSNTLSQKEYYLNSVADTIYLNPLGDLEFKGLATEVMYYKDFQEKMGVKIEVIRHGKYKSAVEPFLENAMSDANREQLSSLLNSIWNSVATEISVSRKISVERLNAIANGLLARTPEMAKNEKLIDKIAYEDEYHAGIRKALKLKKDQKYKSISIEEYAQNIAATQENTNSDNEIAVIYAQGEIGSGEGDINTVGEISMRRSLQNARKNKDVKAIVLRIDSPGGNALTSDLIWREIEITKKSKPVIVSMGNLAASGGYYIACNANQIFAENTTITGSIGVFGQLPNLSALTSKMGIHVEQVATHQNASGYSVFRPLDEKFRAFMLESVEHIYSTFVNRVATGRKMTFEQVDAIAQGRVWSGADAKKNGLVDQIGGMQDALQYAARLVKIKDYKTINFPEFDKDFGDLLGKLPFMQSRESLIKTQIGDENYQLIEQIRKINSKHGAQALLPFDMKIN